MKVCYAAVFQNQELLKPLPNESSIYSAEKVNKRTQLQILFCHL